MLQLTDLYAGYFKEQPILRGLNLRLESNEKIAIFGQNGSGKSTIAKAIMGLLPHIKGDISLDGESIINKTPQQLQRMGIGYFMQGGRVFGHLNALENLKVATSNLENTIAKEQIEKIQNEFVFFENPRRLALEATYLSGGERHQLALAMVFAGNPNMKLLIADEPSAGVTQATSKLILEYVRQADLSVLLIEQNQNLALNTTSKQVILTDGNII
ncbi:ATP-binding cassette domain-containing protein [Arcicella sp. LKC2W]|uniref:ATP-binding cassette domain-containing protein n=1 Tax=Arcicella sp. LKC2W TaxID=2984198 RepID=UPI002B21F3A0|nr:ATP-binding cassette domain-containing protein [Arcicella sp. LKC2W]MEA5461666.1 ATP-binding cassette domain-containing protein [Arcicella sp. LKC2W]